MIGSKLAHYTVLDRLGAGGMGEVYLARDEQLGRQERIDKILPMIEAGIGLIDKYRGG
jgi:serine/threonine protein kinase